jgi:hypothetical protein
MASENTSSSSIIGTTRTSDADIQRILEHPSLQELDQASSIAALRDTVADLANITQTLAVQQEKLSTQSNTLIGMQICSISRSDFKWIQTRASNIFFIIAAVFGQLLRSLL